MIGVPSTCGRTASWAGELAEEAVLAALLQQLLRRLLQQPPPLVAPVKVLQLSQQAQRMHQRLLPVVLQLRHSRPQS